MQRDIPAFTPIRVFFALVNPYLPTVGSNPVISVKKSVGIVDVPMVSGAALSIEGQSSVLTSVLQPMFQEATWTVCASEFFPASS